MTTLLDDKRLGGAATAILGHKTDHDRVDERERMASVTEQHYNRSQRIGLKAEGMSLMGWFGRAPAPPVIEAGSGHRKGARHVSEI